MWLRKVCSTHLNRRHRRPVQCPRCWSTMSSESVLREHLNQDPICERTEIGPEDGVTSENSKSFQKAKRDLIRNLGRYLTREENWRLLYEILFPGETVPSPCKCSVSSGR